MATPTPPTVPQWSADATEAASLFDEIADALGARRAAQRREEELAALGREEHFAQIAAWLDLWVDGTSTREQREHWVAEYRAAGRAPARKLPAILEDLLQRQARERTIALAREFEDALSLLRELVAALRAAPGPCVVGPFDLIRDRWNAALRSRGWRCLPPFCAACGVLVLGRRGRRLRGGARERSFTCSDDCRRLAKSRRGMRAWRRRAPDPQSDPDPQSAAGACAAPRRRPAKRRRPR